MYIYIYMYSYMERLGYSKWSLNPALEASNAGFAGAVASGPPRGRVARKVLRAKGWQPVPLGVLFVGVPFKKSPASLGSMLGAPDF